MHGHFLSHTDHYGLPVEPRVRWIRNDEVWTTEHQKLREKMDQAREQVKSLAIMEKWLLPHLLLNNQDVLRRLEGASPLCLSNNVPFPENIKMI